MILSNITFCVDKAISPAFVDFLRNVFIPASDAEGLHSHLVSEVRVPSEEGEENPARTFALQMRAPSEETLEKFNSDTLPRLLNEAHSRWGMGVATFATTLDIVHDPAKK